MKEIARLLILFGISLAGFGCLLYGVSLIPGVGKLPGDIHVKSKNFSFYFPLATCLIVSVVLTVLINFFFKSK